MTIVSRALQAISNVLPQIDPVQYETATGRRLTQALCTLSVGAEHCDIKRSAFSHLFLRLFKTMAPTPHSSDDNAIGFSWWGQDYQMRCGAGICSLQREVSYEKSEWEQFWEGGFILGCTPAPEEKRLEDAGSFKDAPANSKASGEITFCPVQNKYGELANNLCSNHGPISGYSAPVCVKVLGIYFDGGLQESETHNVASLVQFLSRQHTPSKWTVRFSGANSSHSYLDQFIDMEISKDLPNVTHPAWDSTDERKLVRIAVYPELSPARIALVLGARLFNGLGVEYQPCHDVYESPCASQKCQ